MKSFPLVLAMTTLVYALPAHAQLQDENILVPLPAGFKVGFNQVQGPLSVMEFVPARESVGNWTKMVTRQIRYGLGNADLDRYAQIIAEGWTSACPGGSGSQRERATENGYPVVTISLTCSLNPKTGKPESMWMKAVAGTDALYTIQYAFRQKATSEEGETARRYLAKTIVCDTRTAAHPCPAEMVKPR